MNLPRRLVPLALSAALAAATTACKSPAPLRVGFTPNYPPVCMMVLDGSEGGAIGGIEADFASALARELSCPLTPCILELDDQIDALRKDQTDIAMAGLTPTPARASRVAFCPPYMNNPLVALSRSDDASSFASPDSVFAVSSVGVLAGSSAESFARRHFPRAAIVPIAKRKDVPSHLAASRFHVYIDDFAAAHEIAAAHETSVALLPFPLHPQTLAWAVAPDNPELLRAASAALRKWRANGFLEKTLRTHIPNPPFDLLPDASSPAP